MKKLFVLMMLIYPKCYSIPHAAFQVFDASWNKLDQIEYTNVPPVKTQDGFAEGCFTFLGGAYMDILNCKYEKSDCTSLPDNKSFSRLDIARFTRTPKDPKVAQSVASYNDMFPSDSGFSASNIVQNLINNEFSTTSEECASIDKALAKFDDSREENTLNAQIGWWSALREKYDEFQKIDPTCVQCKETFTATTKEELAQNFNIQQDNTRLLKIFSSKTYGIFLQKLLVPPKCQKERVAYNGPRDLVYKRFPKEKDSNLQDSIEVIKDTLSTKKIPVMVSGLCNDKNYKPSKKCDELHNLMITGYRKVCQKDHPDTCKHSVKVYNTWGRSWQKINDDGWVDAEKLLSRTNYKKGTFSWVEDPPRG